MFKRGDIVLYSNLTLGPAYQYLRLVLQDEKDGIIILCPLSYGFELISGKLQANWYTLITEIFRGEI